MFKKLLNPTCTCARDKLEGKGMEVMEGDMKTGGRYSERVMDGREA